MVFLVEDFVNLPRDQIANIWIAAHMKKKLNKKDITKVCYVSNDTKYILFPTDFV